MTEPMIVAVDGEDGRWQVMDIHWHQGQGRWWVAVEKVGLSYLNRLTCPITSIRPYPSKMRFELADKKQAT